MSKWNVTVAPEFGEDLRNIHSYIANELSEPAIAKRLIDRILNSVKKLSSFPLTHPLYEKKPWIQRGLRKMLIGNYSVFYLANEKAKTVIVLHIFYSGRDIEKCLSDTKLNES